MESSDIPRTLEWDEKNLTNKGTSQVSASNFDETEIC